MSGIAIPSRVSKGIRIGPNSVRDPSGARDEKKTSYQLIFNNSRSSILPGSVPDPTSIVMNIICTSGFHCLMPEFLE